MIKEQLVFLSHSFKIWDIDITVTFSTIRKAQQIYFAHFLDFPKVYIIFPTFYKENGII